MKYDHKIEKSESYEMHLGDACEIIKQIDENNLPLVLFL